ncbi:MAG: S9 family peptidase [Flavobacteriales bacterium]|nr:S9 family peptidase [Flavobacteriales bacterium]NCA19642.1 S9 family peptidase [Crocinitomicaceae bacterium]
MKSFAQVSEPIANKSPKKLTIHNHTRVDDYYWMNERDSKPVLEHLEEENAYAKAYFKPLEGMVNTLITEFDKRINPNEVSSPFNLNGKTYQVKNLEGKDYQQIVQVENGKEVLFFDQNERAKGKSFYELADWSPSPNNELLAVSEDFVGRRKYNITFRQNKNGKFLKDKISDVSGGVVWANDNKTVFYVKKDTVTLREFQIYRHVIGNDSKLDELVFEEKDEIYGVGIGKTITDKYIIIQSYSSTTSEVQLIDANNPTEKSSIFLPRKKGHIYEIEHHTDGFYIISNDNATNKKVLFSATIPTDISQCKEVIAHKSDVLLEGIATFKNYLLVQERTNGLLKIKLRNIASGKETYISFDEETYYLGLGLNDNFETDEIFYSYNSLTTPATVYKYNMTSGEKSLWFRKELLDKTFDPANYVSQRIWATANDGTKIPISIVYKKGLDLATAPCLLYGYGSYGYTLPDVFSPTRLSLLDRGFVYAVAHIRGSKYMGEEWYENGKFQKKTNTFTDFINAAEYLGIMKYCNSEKIYAQGGSAGGLLMGAVTNMAPYLWKGIISQVPFVDVVTTMLDESIPLTTGEYEEWGNPNDADFYYYMLKYSPYDNIHKMDYPAMFVTTGYHDSQVQYWEPMKYIAKLREYRTNKNPLVFDCNMDAGHGGGSGRSQNRLEVAKVYAFILGLEGISK